MMGSVFNKSQDDEDDKLGDIPMRIRQIDGGYNKMMAKKNKHTLSQHMAEVPSSLRKAGSIARSNFSIDQSENGYRNGS